MPVTQATLRELRRLTISINRRVNATNRELVAAWSTAWHEISAEFKEAIDDLIELGDGEWPTRAQVFRAQRATNAMKIASDALDELGDQAGVTIRKGLPLLVDEVDRLTAVMIDTQLPPRQTAVVWNRVDEQAVRSIVRRSTERITAATYPISRRSAAVMRSVLVRGVAVGDNPRKAARLMLKRTQGAFTGGLHRATNIATTEMLDASRYAGQQARIANPLVVAGVVWCAALDHRTCGSCVAKDGQEFPATSFGPEDHPRGRCTFLPITKSWAELGFPGIDEPEPFKRETGREWYDRQDAATQDRVMGKERARRLRDGDLDWGRVSKRSENPGWRPSWGLRPLDD